MSVEEAEEGTGDIDWNINESIELNRQYVSNPFVDRLNRCKFICFKHDSILKQYSSTHFHVPSSNNLLSPTKQKLAGNIGNIDEEKDNKNNNNNNNIDINNQNDSSSSSDQGNQDIDVDDTEPLIFEFPYYLNSTKRNLILMKEHFLQENRVEALKLAIQTARFLIDDLVLSEPQFYPAIYVLVSKLLDKFGGLVYDRLYLLALSPLNSNINEQYQHNFIPQTNPNDDNNNNNNNNNEVIKKQLNEDENDKGWTSMFTSKSNNNNNNNNNDKQIYGTDTDNNYDDEKHQQYILQQQQQKQHEENGMDEKIESLPLNFRASHCSNLCQIKCGNWFFKISAIRELVPRILIEISLYRTLRFLYPLQEILNYTKMLIKRLRGISNPLIAAYVRLFALEQIFSTFGTNSFIYGDDGDIINDAKNIKQNKNNNNKAFDFDMIEDIYLMLLNDVLFIFKSMYDTNFMFVECVFYGQMASEDYLNLFNPIFECIFDILKYNKIIKNVNDIKIYLNQNINQQLLKLIDLNSFLGIKNTDPYILNFDHSTNIYNKNNQKNNKKRRKKRSKQIPIIAFNENNTNNESNNNALSDMAQSGFQNHDTDTIKQ